MTTNGLASGSKRLEVGHFQIAIAKCTFRFGSSFLSLLLGACLLFSSPVYSLSPVYTEGAITVPFNVNESHLSDESKVLLARQLPNIFSLDLHYIHIRAIKTHTKPNVRNVSDGVRVAQNRVDSVRQFFIEAGIHPNSVLVEIVKSVQDDMRTQVSSSSDPLAAVYVQYIGLCKKGYWGICEEIIGPDGLSYSSKVKLAQKIYYEKLKSEAVNNLPCPPESERLRLQDEVGDYPSFDDRVSIASEIGRHPVVYSYLRTQIDLSIRVPILTSLDNCMTSANSRPDSIRVVANVSADGEILHLDFEPKSDVVACVVATLPQRVAPPPTCVFGELPIEAGIVFKSNKEQ